jgi:hypothetical protein
VPLTKVGKFSLKNQAGIVTRIRFSYLNDDGEKSVTGECTGDITLGFEQTASPGDCGVPDGSTVLLYPWIAAAIKDVEAKRSFTFEQGNPLTAHYVISGVVNFNDLALIDVS